MRGLLYLKFCPAEAWPFLPTADFMPLLGMVIKLSHQRGLQSDSSQESKCRRAWPPDMNCDGDSLVNPASPHGGIHETVESELNVKN